MNSAKFIIDTDANASILSEKWAKENQIERCNWSGQLEKAESTVKQVSNKTPKVTKSWTQQFSTNLLLVIYHRIEKLYSDWTGLTKPANEKIIFPGNEADDQDNDGEAQCLLSTVNDTEEPFDEDQVWDMPEHILDMAIADHLAENEKGTVKKMLEMNDDVREFRLLYN